MPPILSGATRLVPIVGDPIAQVRSPAGVTAAFAEFGEDIVCIPMHVAPDDFQTFIATIRRLQNCTGVIVTVPHKFAAFAACDTTSERARFLATVNTIRRSPDGRLHGDMFDGLGVVAACKAGGCVFEGRRALLVGAGGAGTAIAHAVADEGVSFLGIADIDAGRCRRLVDLLSDIGKPVATATADVAGYDIVINATPLGMRAGDPPPVPVEALQPGMFVGDIVTGPEISPLLAAAATRGCQTCAGAAIFAAICARMAAFLLDKSMR